MSTGNVRKGITQANFNEENANILYGEIAVIAILVGLYFQSWYVGGGVLLGLIIAIQIPYLSVIMAIIFSISWSLVGAIIALFINAIYIEETKVEDLNLNINWDASLLSIIKNVLDIVLNLYSTGPSLVVGIIALLAGLGLHLSAIEYTKDVSDTEDRNF